MKVKVGDIVVKEPFPLYGTYEFFKIQKQTPKMVVLNELYVEHDTEYPLTGSARWIYT